MAFRHCVLGKSWLWLFLLGPAPFAFCFVSLLDGEAHILLGDLRFALCGLGLLFFLYCDLPTYMTTGVHVDVNLTCFFSCKDRASERYRPHQRKKKVTFPKTNLRCLQNWLKGVCEQCQGTFLSGRRERKSNMNPVSREIADTNFLETKIYSSKYIIAKT